MGAKDRRIPFDDILHLTHGYHGTAADADPTVVLSGGKHVKQPTAIDSGDVVTLWLGKQGHITPEIQALQLDGTTTSGVAGTGTWTTGLGPYKEVDVLVDVTAVGGTSPSVIFYIDSRLDGTGTLNLARFTAITTAGKAVVHLSKRQAAAQVTGMGSDAGAGTVRAIGWADDLRIRRTISGTAPTATYRVWLNLVS